MYHHQLGRSKSSKIYDSDVIVGVSGRNGLKDKVLNSPLGISWADCERPSNPLGLLLVNVDNSLIQAKSIERDEEN